MDWPGAGNIEIAGGGDAYTFTATAGQTVYFDDQSIRWTGLCWNLYDPDGNNAFCDWLDGNRGPGRYTLPKTGTYWIEVGYWPWGSPSATGPYAFKLWPVADQSFAIAIGDTVSNGKINGINRPGAGNIDAAMSRDIYTFAASAGQIVFFDDQSAGWTGLCWSLFDPDGNNLFQDWLDGNHGPGRFTLPKTGSYRIEVWCRPWGSPSATGPYAFRLSPVPVDQTFSIAIGDAISPGLINAVSTPGAGNIESPGAKDIYNFTAASGQVVYFEDRCSGGTGLGWWVYDENGNAVMGDCLDGLEPGRVILSRGGTYRVEVWGNCGNALATGSYSFRIWAVPPDQEFAISIGTTVSDGVPAAGAGNLEAPGSVDYYTFTASAGDAAFFEDLGTAGGALRWWLRDPDGNLLFDDQLDGVNPGRVDFTKTGTYMIGVYPAGNDANNRGAYRFSIRPIGAEQDFMMIIGDTVSDGLIGGSVAPGAGRLEVPGAWDIYTFNGRADEPVLFEELAVAPAFEGDLWWTVKGPSGQLLVNEPFEAGSSTSPGRRVLPQDGTYTIQVYANSASATHKGAYSFRVEEVVDLSIVINQQPIDQTVAIGQDVSFSVLASGPGPLSYQWRFNNANIPDATSASLSLHNVQPTNAGTYTVVVSNPVRSITSGPASLVVTYCASVAVAAGIYPGGSAVPLVVTTFVCESSSPVPNAPATVWISAGGVTRTISLVTDRTGQCLTNFTLLPGEAGHYSLSAGLPSASTPPTQQGSFVVLGMALSTNNIVHNLTVDVPQANTVELRNLTDMGLSGITAEVVGAAANLTVQVETPDTLLGSATNQLTYVLTATSDAVAWSQLGIRLTSAQGASVVLTLVANVLSTTPELTAAPSSLNAAMERGLQTMVQFEVANSGGAASGDLAVLLPDGAPWLSLVSPSVIPSLEAGGKAVVTLALAPPGDLALGPYHGALVLWSDTASLTIPFQFTCVSELKGNLSVTAKDEFTLYGFGAPKVANATVVVTDAVTGSNTARGVTDASGLVLFTALTEGYYNVEVQADQHGTFRTTVLVSANQTYALSAFLPRQMVSYNWVVTPTDVPDHYDFHLQTTFETEVPWPVVTIDPGAINLCDFGGGPNQVNLTIENHGLIAAQGARLFFGPHPRWELRPLVEDLGDLAAKTSLVVPVTVREVEPSATGPSTIEAHLDYHVTTTDGTHNYSVPIYVYNANPPDCSAGRLPVFEGVTTPPSYVQAVNPVVQVKMRLEQSAVITRSAFSATLELSNTGSEMTDLQVTLDIRDQANNLANGVVSVRPPQLTGLAAVDGTGSLDSGASGRAAWIIIPGPDAAPDQATPYTIGGELDFVQDGEPVHIPLFPVPITVMPGPRLEVDYFLQRDVYGQDPFSTEIEPPVPFALGMIITNSGKGSARAMTITSGQPQIVENESGLLIKFQLLSAQLGDQLVSPSFTLNLGDLRPGGSAEALWWMTASLQGTFTNYSARFTNVDDFGNASVSLIDRVTMHEMVHVVRATTPIDDGLPDFLVNDSGTPGALPDKLYLSDGSVLPVASVTDGTFDPAPDDDHPSVQLATELSGAQPPGWVYLQIPNPSANPLIHVLRSDNSELLIGANACNVWTTHRMIHTPGDEHSEDLIHLLDYNDTPRPCTLTYTLTYASAAAPPVIIVQPKSQSAAQGNAVSFSVGAVSVGSLSYQWQFGGTDLVNGDRISGATSSVLTIANIQASDADAAYQVRVSNAHGTTPSSQVRLLVLRPPQAPDYTVTRAPNHTLKIAVADLLANDADPQGGPLSLTAVQSLSVNGATVMLLGRWVLYAPPTGFNSADSFTYTVENSAGLTASGTVLVTIQGASNSQAQNTVAISPVPSSGGAVTITFAGIPGRTYKIQAADSLTAPVNWLDLASGTAGPNGLFEYVDTDAPNHPTRYYRTVSQ